MTPEAKARVEIAALLVAAGWHVCDMAQADIHAALQTLPPLKEDGLWPAQIIAIQNLEKSLKANMPRALIQMATGSGKPHI